MHMGGGEKGGRGDFVGRCGIESRVLCTSIHVNPANKARSHNVLVGEFLLR